MINRRQFLRSTCATVSVSCLASRTGNCQTTKIDVSATIDREVSAFMDREKLPGASVAITQNGKLVYASGFGFRNEGLNQKTTVNDRFRIASISKSITATAVLKLCEIKGIGLDETVVSHMDLNATDKRMADITIRHLLEHSSGIDDKQLAGGVDTHIAQWVQKELAITRDDMIRYWLARPFASNPGESHRYCNFGYVILGMLIEKISGMDYETFVKKEVLAPLGISKMEAGKTLIADARENEVFYHSDYGYSPSVMSPDQPLLKGAYGYWNMDNILSAGGWIGRAVDLARLGCGIRGQGVAGIISNEARKQMLARPSYIRAKVKKYYGLGVRVAVKSKNETSFWHAGSIDGSSTHWGNRSDGITWVMLFNKRLGASDKEPSLQAGSFVHPLLDRLEKHPKEDLFESLL